LTKSAGERPGGSINASSKEKSEAPLRKPTRRLQEDPLQRKKKKKKAARTYGSKKKRTAPKRDKKLDIQKLIASVKRGQGTTKTKARQEPTEKKKITNQQRGGLNGQQGVKYKKGHNAKTEGKKIPVTGQFGSNGHENEHRNLGRNIDRGKKQAAHGLKHKGVRKKGPEA